MLPKVSIGRHSSLAPHPDPYRPRVGDALIDELLGLARELKDVRISHLHSTVSGGGGRRREARCDR